MLMTSIVIRISHQSKKNQPRITEQWRMMICLFHVQLSLQEAVLPAILLHLMAMANLAVCLAYPIPLSLTDQGQAIFSTKPTLW